MKGTDLKEDGVGGVNFEKEGGELGLGEGGGLPPMSLMPSKQIVGQTVMCNGTTSSPNNTQHSEWHHVTVSVV